VVGNIAREENHALARLADAVAGFVRMALVGDNPEIKELFDRAKRHEVFIEVWPQKNHRNVRLESHVRGWRSLA